MKDRNGDSRMSHSNLVFVQGTEILLFTFDSHEVKNSLSYNNFANEEAEVWRIVTCLRSHSP